VSNYDVTLVGPNLEQLRQALAEAARAANAGARQRLVEPTAEDAGRLLADLSAQPEGYTEWDAGAGPRLARPASVVCAAWATDGLGVRHCRVVGARPRLRSQHALAPHERLPLLARVHPRRAAFLVRGKERALWLACPCGQVGDPDEICWGADGCEACRGREPSGHLKMPWAPRGHTWPYFSPDARTLAVCNTECEMEDGETREASFHVWDTEGRRLRGRFPGDEIGAVVVFSPDGRLFATGVHGRGVRLWDAETLDGRGSLEVGREVAAAAFSPDGRVLAVARLGGGVEVWDVPTRERSRTLAGGPRTFTTSLAFSPDGRYLALEDEQTGLRVWEMPDGQERLRRPGRIYTWNGGGVTAGEPCLVTAWSVRDEDGRALPQTLDAWDLSAGTLRKSAPPGSAIAAARLSPDGHTLALFAHDDKRRGPMFCQAPDFTAWRDGRKRHKPDTLYMPALVFAPDGKTLAICEPLHQFSVWDVGTARELGRLEWPGRRAEALAFAPDGDLLLVTSAGEEAYLTRWAWRETAPEGRT
jgi:dipeptidyl aminopeptidase/acylaminoacyl peptidase